MSWALPLPGKESSRNSKYEVVAMANPRSAPHASRGKPRGRSLWVSPANNLEIIPNVYVQFSAQCIAPLGMENGAIRDEDITASSSFDSGNVGPQNGR